MFEQCAAGKGVSFLIQKERIPLVIYEIEIFTILINYYSMVSNI